jgi:predicted O-methyltransferase YrrM
MTEASVVTSARPAAPASMRQSLTDRLYDGRDPFEAYVRSEPGKAGDDTLPDGWGSSHPYFKQFIEELRPRVIVEIGTWLGGSAVHMGRLLRAAGLNDSCVICIDTWLGSSEHYLYEPGKSHLKLVNGRATFYEDFMRNVVQHGVQDLILPFSITSVSAVHVLRELNCIPDLVYLDGDHSARGFRADLDLYWDLLRPGGVLIGDDFDWEDVQTNVINFAYLTKVEFTAFSNKFVMRKPD